VLNGGKLVYDGQPSDAIAYYLSNIAGAVDESDGVVSWTTDAPEVDDLRLRRVRIFDTSGRTQGIHDAKSAIGVEVDYEVKKTIRGARMSVFLSTQEGEVAFISTDHQVVPDQLDVGVYRSTCTIPGGLLNQRVYVVGVSWDIPAVRIVFPRRDCISLSVTGGGNQGSTFPEAWPGVVCPVLAWKVERL
jgi:lipopolysaccharide transport system ATP-binding protein